MGEDPTTFMTTRELAARQRAPVGQVFRPGAFSASSERIYATRYQR
jgi:hypothetical protein